jgi:hypothetical protein
MSDDNDLGQKVEEGRQGFGFGTPEEVSKMDTWTGKFLRKTLK